MTFTIAQAGELAFTYHAGQVDKKGRDYVGFHIIPVVALVTQLADEAGMEVEHVEYVMKVAWLHDILEDTSLTFEELEGAAGAAIANDVRVLTRREGEVYQGEYIERVRPHLVPRLVKLADNRVNRRGAPADLAYRYDRAYERLRFS